MGKREDSSLLSLGSSGINLASSFVSLGFEHLIFDTGREDEENDVTEDALACGHTSLPHVVRFGPLTVREYERVRASPNLMGAGPMHPTACIR